MLTWKYRSNRKATTEKKGGIVRPLAIIVARKGISLGDAPTEKGRR